MSSDEYITVAEKDAHLFKVMKSKRFLMKEGLGNEVPFFICPYDPKDMIEIETKVAPNLVKRLSIEGISVLHLNLYDLAIEILKEQDAWDDLIAAESEYPRDEIMEVLQNLVNAENYLIPKIAEKAEGQKFDILFLSGVGAVFPYLRSHTVLNNLQSTIKEQATVLFFPGQYLYSESKGRSLNLFGKFEDDEYYRAFNIFDYQV